MSIHYSDEWTPARVETLRTMAVAGHSASVIAEALGGTTRNAVISKCHRVGVQLGFWNGEKLEQLKTLHAEGRSMTEIAATLDCTRNAVMGKAWRLGLITDPTTKRSNYLRAHKKRLQKSKPHPKPVTPRAAKPNAPAPVKISGGRIYNMPPDRPLRPERPHNGVRVPLLDLEPHTCRFPFGDPREASFGFCAADAPDGSYCSEHHRLTTTKSQPAKIRFYDASSRRAA